MKLPTRGLGSFVGRVAGAVLALFGLVPLACSVFGSSLDHYTSGGSASCAAGQTRCGASCVDTQTDDQNCGACANNCGVGKKCDKGQCIASCTTAQTLCSGACVDTQSNQNNCGSCGNACKAGETCTKGKCEIACPGGQTACGGLCYDLLSDGQHCGSCTNACTGAYKCSNGQCSLNCQSGQKDCSGSCVDLTSNSQNCGSCGNACGANQECSGSQCVIACKTLLNQSITDPWGYAWDGLERAATTYDQAKATCDGISGRLPTASELFRVSATQSATVGQTSNTNFLWSIVPNGAANHVRVRLSDASTSSIANSSSLNYRCVCPPPQPSAYVGGNCYGPSGQACYALDTEGKRYNMDVQDRAPLPTGSAIWECGFYRGHLPRLSQYAEAILQGIGAGSNAWLQTSDTVRNDLNAVVSWSDPTAWKYQYIANTNAASWAAMTDLRPFRCIGVNYDAGTHPATVPNEYVGPLGGYKGETQDTGAAAWADAQDACVSRGGHLPMAAELDELVTQGLPNGGGANLWTADQDGYNGVQFLVEVVMWNAVDTATPFSSPASVTWMYRTSAGNPFRCIFYPVDSSYQGPANSDCAGGCTVLPLPGSSGAKMWIDSFDRAPPATLQDATNACRQKGGHLASERDLTEAIRQGLPNGSGTWILTSDAELGSGTTGWNVGAVKWSGTDTAFTDQYSTYSTWAAPQNPIPYRCVWTNELR